MIHWPNFQVQSFKPDKCLFVEFDYIHIMGEPFDFFVEDGWLHTLGINHLITYTLWVTFVGMDDYIH